jgi:RNA polymerase sigma factor (sigma-70 family)
MGIRDGRLVAVAYTGGEPAAVSFDDLLAVHWSMLVRVAGRVSPPGMRDDVLQEAVTGAWRSWDTYDADRGSVRSWMIAIVADRARRAWRRHRVWHPLSDDLHVAPADSEIRADVERAIAALPARQRLAVQLRYYVDLPVAEIAEVMRCTAGTVSSTLHDARATLRSALGDEYR